MFIATSTMTAILHVDAISDSVTPLYKREIKSYYSDPLLVSGHVGNWRLLVFLIIANLTNLPKLFVSQ